MHSLDCRKRKAKACTHTACWSAQRHGLHTQGVRRVALHVSLLQVQWHAFCIWPCNMRRSIARVLDGMLQVAPPGLYRVALRGVLAQSNARKYGDGKDAAVRHSAS